MSPSRPFVALAAALLLTGALTGCTSEPLAPPRGGDSYMARGFDGATWPDLHGAKVRVLAYGAFTAAFDAAREAFENHTNGTAELLTAPDSGQVLERAIRERGDPSFDVVYGVDNVLLGRALREGVFETYHPLLASRLNASLVFAPGWEATPVNHGYIGVNVDPRENLSIQNLDDLRTHAGDFVTEDPRTSTPGLGFLLATVATYGDEQQAKYDYLDYWNDLFRGGVLVTSDWTDAYENHFRGGYGQFEEGSKHDRAIVTSYTTSPAYEMYYNYTELNANVLAPKATFHQIQTMGIANGTANRVAAEAWMEFALSDDFQELAANGEAIYPAVEGVGTSSVYQGRDPAPGTFQDTGFSYQQIDRDIERWLAAWTDAYQRARA
jgi:thiamine transport system substrate-binding protein